MRTWRMVVAAALPIAGGLGFMTLAPPAHAAPTCVALAGGKSLCAGSSSQCFPGGCGEGHDDHTDVYVGTAPGYTDRTGVDIDCPINFIQVFPSTGEAALLLNGQVVPLVPVPACSEL